MIARRVVLALGVIATLGGVAWAQFPGGGRRGMEVQEENIPYDGRFVFARIKYEVRFGRDLPWAHDYPRAERHFTKLLSELSTVVSYQEGGNILTLDDPELFKYPVAYMSEPGFWTLSPAEIEGMRAYIAKGGFMIFDDFYGNQWYNFEEQIRVVLPDAHLQLIPLTHPVWDSFFRIESLEYDHPNFDVKAVFLGIFEDNDPTGRLLAVVNYNNDLGDYWEWSDTDLVPIDLSNTAYKLGINYVIYAMTH